MKYFILAVVVLAYTANAHYHHHRRHLADDGLQPNTLGNNIARIEFQCAAKGLPCHCPNGEAKICGVKHCTKSVKVDTEIKCDAKTMKLPDNDHHKHCVCTHMMDHKGAEERKRNLRMFHHSKPRKLGKTPDAVLLHSKTLAAVME